MEGLYERFKEYVNWGMGLAIALSSFLLSRDRLEAQLLNGSTQAALSLCVLGATIIWMLRFIRATSSEPELFRDEKILERIDAKNLTRMVDSEAFVVMAVLSLGFGGLIATVTYPVTYCIIAVAIQLTDCLGLTAIQRTLFEIYKGATDLNPDIYAYYVYKPQSLHRAAKLIGFMSALALAVAAHFSGQPRFALISSTLVIATIVGGESVLFFWRRWLYARISGRK